jgi:hypothetical protein
MFTKRSLFVVLSLSTMLLAVGPAWASSPANDAIPDGITLTLTTPPLQIIEDGEGFDRPQLEGFYPSGSPGDPALPSKIYNVALPPDVTWSSVKMEVIGAETVEWPGTYEVAPAPPATTWVDGREIAHWGEHTASIVDGKNAQVYQSDAYFPPSSATLAAASQMRKWRFVRLLFTPLQYHPVSGKLRLVTEVEVRIAFERDTTLDAERLQLELNDTVMDDRAAEMLYNYEQAKGWYRTDIALAETQADYYVIVTTDAIVAQSDTLEDFVAHKQAHGWNVLVVTEGQYDSLIGPIPCQAPCGRAERIRRWLIQNRPVYGIEYVLLIGNPDPDDPDDPSDPVGDVPMKLMYPRPDSEPGTRGDWCYAAATTDYFYADLSGNWDLNGNGDFGEYEDYPAGDKGTDGLGQSGVDFAPDVYVGRIPVYDNVAGWQGTLDGILQKIIDYETSGDLTWRKRTLLPMSFSDDITDGAYMAEAMKSNYLSSGGYIPYTLYEQGTGGCTSSDSIYDSDEDLLHGAVRAHWQKHDYGIVTWWAHGGSIGAGIGYGNCPGGTLLESGDTAALDDKHPAFVYQCSCLNGNPEYFNNLGYALLKKGAIGTVSASRCSGYYKGNFAPNPNLADNAHIGYYFTEQLTSGDSAGHALYDVMGTLGHNGLTDWINPMLFNLYGDPSTSIDSGHPWPPAAPTNLVATTMPESHIHLSWTDNSDNETIFKISRRAEGGVWLPRATVGVNTTVYTDTGLCGTTYEYLVSAYNAYGEAQSSVASAPASELDEYEADDTPAQATEIAVNHSGQDHNFHAAEDKDWVKFTITAGHAYAIRAMPWPWWENGTALELYDTDGTTLLAENTACTIGSRDSCINDWVASATGTYYARARDRFDGGGCTGYDYSLWVFESSAPATWPAAPTDLAAAPLAHDQVSLSWTDNSDNEEGFKIERWGIAGGMGMALWKQVATIGANYTSLIHSGLTCNTTYRYRIRAYNADGDSYPSLAVAVTTGVQDTYEPDNTPAEAQLVVPGGGLFHTFHSAEDEDWGKFYVTGGNVCTVTTSNLGANNDTVLYLYDTDGTTLLAWNYNCPYGDADACIHWVAGSSGWYYARVANLGGEGGCPGYEYKLTVVWAIGDPDWPDTPTNLAATAISHDQIDLSWTDNSDDEEGFKVERWGVSLPPYDLPLWKEIFIVGPDGANYSDTGLACNTNYRYRLRAYNESGDSGYTQVVSATTVSMDGYEDDFETLPWITVNGGAQSRNFHHGSDQDWARFAATASEVYTVTTSNLGAGADTLLQLYDGDGATLLVENNDCVSDSLASCIHNWAAPETDTYYLKVLSRNEGGGCPGYEYDLIIVDSNLGSCLPPAPSNLTATAASPDQSNLSWTASGAGSRAAANGDAEGFVVERRYGSAWMQVAKVGSDVTHYKDTGLYCGLTYEYRVGAYNASGSSDYTAVSVTTTDCPCWLSEIYLPLVLRNF